MLGQFGRSIDVAKSVGVHIHFSTLANLDRGPSEGAVSVGMLGRLTGRCIPREATAAPNAWRGHFTHAVVLCKGRLVTKHKQMAETACLRLGTHDFLDAIGIHSQIVPIGTQAFSFCGCAFFLSQEFHF
jgi:hypothetical protein